MGRSNIYCGLFTQPITHECAYKYDAQRSMEWYNTFYLSLLSFCCCAVALEKGKRLSKFSAKEHEYSKGYRLNNSSSGQVVEKRDVLFVEQCDKKGRYWTLTD